MAALLLSAFAAGCGESSGGGTETKVVTEVRTVDAPADDASASDDTSPQDVSDSTDDDSGSAGGSGSFTMPDEVGKGLQDAQDDIQSASGNPVFFTDSTDATGAGRMQILDRNWKVCSQNVDPGSRVDEDADISFAAVKLNESCP